MKIKTFSYTPGSQNVEEFDEEVNGWLSNKNINIINAFSGVAQNYGWANGDRFVLTYFYEEKNV